MKRFALAVIVICISTLNVFSQKSKLQTASNYFREPYQQYDKAKEAIDEVVLHEQTKGMAKSWYMHGLIYQVLYGDPKYGKLCDNCLVTAYKSYQKALEIDPQNEWVTSIKEQKDVIIYTIFNEGADAFGRKSYDSALTWFEQIYNLDPTDTNAVMNSALSAEQARNLEKAKFYYGKLIEMKYPRASVYHSKSNVEKQLNDTAAALKTIMDGRARYPDTISLLHAQINILLPTGQSDKVVDVLNEAIKKDPGNASVYLALGNSYDNLANPKTADGKDLPKPKDYAQNMTAAEETYKKGLTVAPDDYLLNFSLGAFYFNQAAEMSNQANKITDNNEFAKAKVKFDAKFKEAEPYLIKSMQSNPKKTADEISTYNDTLNSLKALYAKTGETEKYNNIKALIDKK